MQFLTVSDEVVPTVYSLSARERFAAVECVLACGDLPFYYLEFLVTTLGVPFLYVQGTHDKPEVSEREQIIAPRGCISVDRRSHAHAGILIAGLGGCLRYNRDSGAQYTETEQMLRLLALAPRLFFNRLRHGRYVDIFLTHAPPRGIHDGHDRPHHGFRAFHTVLQRFQPRYLIHGHIHHTYGYNRGIETQSGATTILNTVGYRLLNYTAGER